jgi:hypothetical protein
MPPGGLGRVAQVFDLGIRVAQVFDLGISIVGATWQVAPTWASRLTRRA